MSRLAEEMRDKHVESHLCEGSAIEAAVEEAIERCAKEADKCNCPDKVMCACEEIAARIRSL